MQFDRTQIAIRERSFLDIADLSLQVLRRDFVRLSAALAMGAIPVAVVNHLLIARLIGFPLPDSPRGEEEFSHAFQYVANCICLTILTAPLGTLFLTWYLGRLMFFAQPHWKELLRETFRISPRWIISLVLERGIAVGWFWYVITEPGVDAGSTVLIWMFFTVGGFGLIRVFRPFISEVILLEQNPLFTRKATTKTILRRSKEIHGPSSGEIFGRSIASAFLGAIVFGMLLGGLLFAFGILTNDWTMGPFRIQVVMPFALWIIAGYLAIVRFLSYLDVRIRTEGWEVELRMRAEASRLMEQAR